MDDMRGYYLLGYYSSNAKADGRFRSIKVRVKRPKVHIRARRGYLAPTEAELKSDVAGIPVGRNLRLVGEAGRHGARQAEFAGWNGDGSGGRRTRAARPHPAQRGPPGARRRDLAGRTGWAADAGGVGGVRVRRGRGIARTPGGTRAPTWRSNCWIRTGSSIAKTAESLDRDKRFVLATLGAGGPLTPGSYTARVTSTPVGATTGTTLMLPVTVPGASDASGMGQAVLFRRGPFSGSDWQPTGDLRYHRQERVKVETAVTGETTATAVRLLDRTGRPLPLPVAASLRVEGGVTVVVGEVTLAPLGVGDYILETRVTRGEATHTRLVAIRIVP